MVSHICIKPIGGPRLEIPNNDAWWAALSPKIRLYLMGGVALQLDPGTIAYCMSVLLDAYDDKFEATELGKRVRWLYMELARY